MGVKPHILERKKERKKEAGDLLIPKDDDPTNILETSFSSQSYQNSPYMSMPVARNGFGLNMGRLNHMQCFPSHFLQMFLSQMGSNGRNRNPSDL